MLAQPHWGDVGDVQTHYPPPTVDKLIEKLVTVHGLRDPLLSRLTPHGSGASTCTKDSAVTFEEDGHQL